jgi:hypothetical protein
MRKLWTDAARRPLTGNIKAEDALNTINVFEGRLNRLQEDFSLVCRAKEVGFSALEVPY